MLGIFGVASIKSWNKTGTGSITWLSVWVLGSIWLLWKILWPLLGKEIVTITPDYLSLRRAILGIGYTTTYQAAHIKNLRAVAVLVPFYMRSYSHHWWLHCMNILWGTLAFDYGSLTVRFGCGVDEAEAKHILAKIIARFPSYHTDIMARVEEYQVTP